MTRSNPESDRAEGADGDPGHPDRDTQADTISRDSARAGPRSKQALFQQMLRFGSVGLFSNAVYYTALGLLVYGAELGLSIAAAFSYATSMVANYLLQRRVTFKSQRRHREALSRYLAVQGVALAVNALLLEVLVTRLGWPYLLGQGIALVTITIWNYVAQRLWVFLAAAPPDA